LISSSEFFCQGCKALNLNSHGLDMLGEIKKK
jgi:hypothetical protein